VEISTKRIDNANVSITAKVDKEEIDKKIERLAKEAGKQVKVAGFRKGKVPKSIIQRDYAREIQTEVMQKLIQETLGDAIRQSEVSMLLEPRLDSSSDVKADEPFKYSVLMDIEPEFEVPDFRKFELVKPKIEVTEEEVGEQLEALRRHFGSVEMETEIRPLKEGDILKRVSCRRRNHAAPAKYGTRGMARNGASS